MSTKLEGSQTTLIQSISHTKLCTYAESPQGNSDVGLGEPAVDHCEADVLPVSLRVRRLIVEEVVVAGQAVVLADAAEHLVHLWVVT